MSAASAPFDLEGPLPTGTSVLEASAGTGKTYTIARLVSRYVSEGPVDMDRLLVISFSRDATRELRERVRERLVTDRDAAAPGPVRDRLDRALAGYDGATVTTTHGFCHAMLRELGTAADHDRDAVLVEDPSDLVTEVADDLYVRKWGHPHAGPADLTPGQFHELAREVTRDPATPLVPRPEDTEDDGARLRARVAQAVRDEVDRRKRAGRLLDYDDMVLRLDAALKDPDTEAVAAARMRARFSVVLVDEFQDTDPSQWSILRRAFHGHATLVLVGDPKQAVYGFRGADVHAYLNARDAAAARATLPRNHRSDPGVLDGLGALFGGAALGDERIRVLPVQPAHSGRMIDAGAPVQLRVVPREGHSLNTQDLVPAGAARATIREDCARQVVGLIAGGTVVHPRDSATRDSATRDSATRDSATRNGAPRPLHPGDIAVIVRNNSEALAVQERLRAAGVPAVVSGRTSVFTTPAAQEWQALLEALEQPHRTARVRRLALGRLVGMDAAALADPGEALEELGLQLRGWTRVLADRGVAALFEAVSAGLGIQERLLSQPDGERLLTDLRHVGEVLHEAALEDDLGLTALASWLHRRREERDDVAERSRRLETDADAVQVLTSHMSKGLEFPVVLAPSLWSNWSPTPPYPRFHDADGVRTRDVGGPGGPDFAAHVSAHQREDADEELRLAYVTLTRAQSLVITWWAPTANTGPAPLHRLLMHDDPTTVAPFSIPVPSDADALTRFRARAEASSGALTVDVVPVGDDAPAVGVWDQPVTGTPVTRLARFERGLDLGWRRTSYSALTAAAHEAAYAGGSGAGGSGAGGPSAGTSGAGSAGAGSAGAGSAGAGSAGAGSASPSAAGARAGATPGSSPGSGGAPGAFGSAAPGAFGSEPETAQKDDEADVDDTVVGGPLPGDPDAHLHEVPSLWHELPGGTGFGTLVHHVLERYDPAVHAPSTSLPERRGSVADLVGSLTRGQGIDTAALVTALETALATPLGPLADGLSFGQVSRADLLPELDFELPLAGGDSPNAAPALLSGLVDLWRTHVPAGLLAGYADALAGLGEASLRGYLSGSIDAVVRIRPTGPDAPATGSPERYLVVDHKTNRLAPREEPLTAWHYRASALEESMTASHYPLQALLYAVALHRYLRWRRAGYEPGTHLGGVLYLYLRGMSGPGVTGADGHVPGVFSWRPPSGLVTAFSDLLAGEA